MNTRRRCAVRVQVRVATLLTCLLCAILGIPTAAQFFGHDHMNRMDHGPFASTTISVDPLSSEGILVEKGVALRVDSGAVMVFDTDLLRVAAAWTGGFLNWYPALRPKMARDDRQPGPRRELLRHRLHLIDSRGSRFAIPRRIRHPKSHLLGELLWLES